MISMLSVVRQESRNGSDPLQSPLGGQRRNSTGFFSPQYPGESVPKKTGGIISAKTRLVHQISQERRGGTFFSVHSMRSSSSRPGPVPVAHGHGWPPLEGSRSHHQMLTAGWRAGLFSRGVCAGSHPSRLGCDSLASVLWWGGSLASFVPQPTGAA